MTWFDSRPVYVMGIVNVTPDSFSDGGRFFDTRKAVDHALRLAEEGADILDIGGESTRPGAGAVTPQEEQDRILPVVEALKGRFVSVDTRNAATMRAAIAAGAGMLNDITALTHDPDAMRAAASFGGPVCLMHMQGTPETMQAAPFYENVVEEVYAYLQSRIDACVAAGIARDRLVVDPGFGFGKTFAHNMALLEGFARFGDLGVPVLAGLSRKRFIGEMMGGVPPEKRLEGSLRAAATAVAAGARIVRVHDVAETVAFLGV